MTASARIGAFNSPAMPAGTLANGRSPRGTAEFHAVLQKQSAEPQEASAPESSRSQARIQSGRNTKTRATTEAPAKPRGDATPKAAAQDASAAGDPQAAVQASPIPLTPAEPAPPADPANPAPASQGDSESFTYAVETLPASDTQNSQESPGPTAARAPRTNSNAHALAALLTLPSMAGASQSAAGNPAAGVEPGANSLNPAVPAQTGQQAELSSATPNAANGRAPANASAAESATAADPRIDATVSSGPSTAPVAFEARLSPTQNAQESQSSAQSGLQPAGPLQSGVPAVPSAPTPEATSPAPLNLPAPKAEAQFATVQAPEASAAPQSEAKTISAPPSPSAAERMQQLIEPPAQPAPSHNTIVVKVPGETGEGGIDLRFSERGGAIHLSVRTPDQAAAQELRGNLNDFVGSMAHAGIRAEISNPAGASSQSFSSSSDGQNADQRDPGRQSSGRQQQDGGSNEQNSRGSSRWKWMEALQQSNGFSKEQNL